METDTVQALASINERLRRQFDLNLNPAAIEFTDEDIVIKKWRENPGFRIPGSFDPFETAVSIILGQAVSIKQANLFTGRLVQKYGEEIGEGDLSHIFPTPQALMNEDLESIGITKMRANGIRNLAGAVASGEIQLADYSNPSLMEKKLLALKGIGPWTSSLILMRCLNYGDSLPKNDLLIKKLVELNCVDFELWHPWASYLTIVAWNHYQAILEELA